MASRSGRMSDESGIDGPQKSEYGVTMLIGVFAKPEDSRSWKSSLMLWPWRDSKNDRVNRNDVLDV